MKGKSIIGLVLVIVVALAGAGYYVWGRKGQAEFEEVPVARETLEVKITATGGVQPQNRLEIKPPVAGRIDKILFQEGDRVRKGTILAWMSSTERVALIDGARARGAEELKRWEEMYRPTPIVAPMTGILISKKVESGQTLTAADVALVMSNNLIVRADVDETDIAKIKVGEVATIVLDAYPKESVNAKVDHIAFDAKTVNNVTVYSVDLLPENVPDFMRSGMSANVTFVIDKKEDALAVRSDAIGGQGRGEAFVLVKSADGGSPPRKIAVSTGITDGKMTEITKGLDENAVVLVPKMISTGKKQSGTNPFGFQGRGGGGGGHK